MTVTTAPRNEEEIRSTSRTARLVAALASGFGVALITSGVVGLFEDEPGTRSQRMTWMVLVPVGLGITYAVLAAVVWRHGSRRPGRWAWVAGAFVVVGFFAAVSVLIRVSVIVGLDPFEADSGTTSQNFWTGITMLPVLLAAPIVATFELIRLRRVR